MSWFTTVIQQDYNSVSLLWVVEQWTATICEAKTQVSCNLYTEQNFNILLPLVRQSLLMPVHPSHNRNIDLIRSLSLLLNTIKQTRLFKLSFLFAFVRTTSKNTDTMMSFNLLTVSFFQSLIRFGSN